MSSLGLRNGIVVAVSLNPAASTSFVDPRLNKLASEIAVRKYVAILSGIVRLSSPPKPLVFNVADTHKLFPPPWSQSVDQDGNTLADIYFIGPGMPRQNDQYDENESMSIPISPAKKHPSGRRPLQLSNPLPWLDQDCYVRTLLTERQVRIFCVTRKKTSSTPQTPRSGSSSSTATLATSVVMVADVHLRGLVTLCNADQREARAPEIVMPRSDSDSELTRARTRDSVDRDSWTEEAGFRPPNRLFLSFDVWLDPTVCSELPEPNGLRKELEQLYM